MATAIYLRVSTSGQARDGISLDAQKELCLQYARQNGLTVTHTLCDAGISGYSITKRDALRELLQLVKSKEIDSIVCYSLSRLSRKLLDCLSLLELFEQSKIVFVSLKERIDTGSSMGKFLTSVISAINQLERDMASERTKDSLRVKRSNGFKLGGQAPYGFRSDDTGKLIPLSEEQKLVSLVCQLRQSGLSFKSIADTLSDEGFTSRNG